MVAIQNRRQYGPILSDSVIRVTPKREGIPNVKTAYYLVQYCEISDKRELCTRTLQYGIRRRDNQSFAGKCTTLRTLRRTHAIVNVIAILRLKHFYVTLQR